MAFFVGKGGWEKEVGGLRRWRVSARAWFVNEKCVSPDLAGAVAVFGVARVLWSWFDFESRGPSCKWRTPFKLTWRVVGVLSSLPLKRPGATLGWKNRRPALTGSSGTIC